MIYLSIMRLLYSLLGATVLSVMHSTAVNANPPHSTAQGVNWHCNAGYRRMGNQCRKSNVIQPPPASAVGQGAHWYCEPGYQRVAGQCRKQGTSASGLGLDSGSGGSTIRTAPGTTQVRNCDPGYERIGSQCQKTPTPPNAFRVGTGWTCYKGYTRVGDQCQKTGSPQ